MSTPPAAEATAADAHPGDSVELHLPRPTAIAIYFPGYINPESPATALSTLGGEKALSAALAEQPAFLKLRLRPEDPHSHPLFGERVQQPGLLLRIARPKGQADAVPKVTCVARVTATYAFNGLADYQYLGHDPQQERRHQPPNNLALSGANLPTAAEPLRRPGPFLLLPPLFSKVDMPVAYGFKDTAAAMTGAEQEAAPVPQPGSKGVEPRIISFYSTAAPPALPLDDSALTAQQQQHLPRLQALLQQRPAWQLEALLDQLPGCSEEVLKPLLVALCYQFKTGPWKSLWVCCGVDPRDIVDLRRYQILQYRLPGEWAKRVRAAKQTGSPMQQPPLSAMWSFSSMPVTYSTPLQLCDLQDEAIRQLVASAPVTNICSEAYGWFTYASTQQMQQAINMAFSKAYKQALQQQQPSQPSQPPAAAAARGEAAAGAEDRMEVDGAAAAGEQQQQQQTQDAEGAAAAAAEQQLQVQAAEGAAAAAAEDLVGMLGLGAADEDLKEWLQETAAAAEQRQQQRAAAVAAAAAAGDVTDGGVSESDWEVTSAGDTTEGEDDGLTSEGDWGTDGGESEAEEGDEYSAYNEDV